MRLDDEVAATIYNDGKKVLVLTVKDFRNIKEISRLIDDIRMIKKIGVLATFGAVFGLSAFILILVLANMVGS